MGKTFGNFRLVDTEVGGAEYVEITDWSGADLKDLRTVVIPIKVWREIVEDYASYFDGRSEEDTTWGPLKEFQ